MEKILLVEDDKTIGTIIKRSIESILNFEVYWVKTYKDAINFMAQYSDFFLAILDYHLPDAPNGEIIDTVIEKNIPTIVFTSDFTKKVRNHVWSKKVIDYVLKDSARSIDYINELILRIYKNQKIKLLIVDDSETFRNIIKTYLQLHNYIIFEADDGNAALEILKQNPEIKMIITDYDMPEMDGIELIRAVREKYSRHELSIIGLSSMGNDILSAKFIKNGANDFLTKPFIAEEFYCRVAQNIEIIEHMETIKELSEKDYLTKLYNRNFFFNKMPAVFTTCKEGNKPLAVAMLDIDHFKQVNDTYGHDAGDEVLKKVSNVLKNYFTGNGILSRFGGEEFCVVIPDLANNETRCVFEEILKLIESSCFYVNDKVINLTISIGVCSKMQESLEKMITHADMMLYRSKKNGRNQVTIY